MRNASTRARRVTRGLGVLATIAALTIAARGAQAPKFYDDDPLWHEPVRSIPDVTRYEPNLLYDSVENMFTKPGDPDFDKRAGNVNTVDEVMDGPWFTNRAGTRPLTVEEVARGANTGSGPAPGKWVISSAKSDGVTPGFTVRDVNKDLWFLKFDPPGYRGMGSGTEVAAARLFWALGYHTVEYYIVQMRPEDLEIGETATFTYPGAKPRKMRESDVRWLMKRAQRDPDGTYRVIVSKAAPGRPVGRIVFHGTRSDDPNDIVPHENRRELRGYRVFAAWLNHVDAKSINSLDALVKEGDKQYIRHYLLDFSSTLGAGSIHAHEHFEGFEPVLEPFGEIGKRALSLGFRVPDWRTIKFFDAPSIGRVPVDHSQWDPDEWSARFPNAVFLRAREDDTFWAARKLRSITDDLIATAIRAGQFGDNEAEGVLMKFLRDRRDIILAKYLNAVNPVVSPAMDASGTLSFGNAAVEAGVAKAPADYKVAWARFDNATGQTTPIGETSGTDRQQAPAGVSGAEFVRAAISASGGGAQASWAQPIHAYFRRAGNGWKLVGLERLPHRP
jgi:RimJ/RimL family protein N-acetyltransferase